MSISMGDYATLSTMITPALLLTSTGSLIISTSNRMSRIVDRSRSLNDLLDQAGRGDAALDYLPERLAHWNDQMELMIRRGDVVRWALILLYAAFGTFVGTSLAIAVDAVTGPVVSRMPTALAVVGVLLLLAACVAMVREALIALQGNRNEVRFYRMLRARRATLPIASPA